LNPTLTYLVGINAAFSSQSGKNYSLRFQIVGNTLSAKVWVTGGTEPSNWMITATDNTLASGYCGLRNFVPNGITANYSSFIATSL
jgi:hypothetical protein